jgi:hypothetical protein
VSDTHGLLRPEVLQVFKRVERILHAGDIGSPAVLQALRNIAPVVAVRGNNDREPWASQLPESAEARIGDVRVYVLHDVKEMDINPLTTGFQVVVSGHSHRPAIETRDGILFVNPGSAGPRRFKLPVSVARLIIQGCKVAAEIIELPV